MEKFNQISELVLPAPEFADFAVRAAAAGVSLPYYLGVLCLTGAYGFAHPEVRAFLSRPTPGICGPVIEGAVMSDIEAITVRVVAVPVDLLPAVGRGPCEGCDFLRPVPTCEVMRARAVAWGLPGCAGGYVYREVWCE